MGEQEPGSGARFRRHAVGRAEITAVLASIASPADDRAWQSVCDAGQLLAENAGARHAEIDRITAVFVTAMSQWEASDADGMCAAGAILASVTRSVAGRLKQPPETVEAVIHAFARLIMNHPPVRPIRAGAGTVGTRQAGENR